MTTIQIIALIGLALVFALSIGRHINLGVAAIPGAFVVAEIAGITPKELYAGFPTKLVLLILGVMFLWNHVRSSGLSDIIVERTVGLTRGRRWLLPWATCGLTALICSVGALPAAALVITLPVARQIAKYEGIRPALIGIVTIQGAGIGGFSPLSPWGNLIATEAERGHLAFLAGHFFVAQVVLNLLIAIAAFFIFGGVRLFGAADRARRAGDIPQPASAPTVRGLSGYQYGALFGFSAFIVLVLLKFDVGLTGFAIGLLLHIVFPSDTRKAIESLPWNIVLLIAGVLIYVGLLQKIGVLDSISQLLGSVHQPALALLGVNYLGTILANFESSSVAVLGLVIPVGMHAVTHTASAASNSVVLAMLSGTIAVMGASPFHLAGGLLLAETGGDDRTFRDLLLWAIGCAIVLPLGMLLL